MSGWARPTALVLALAGLGCRPVPATIEVGNDDPPAPAVIAEPPPQPPANGSIAGSTMASEDILGLYRCWFRNPYEYMFTIDGEPLQVQGRDYGVFTAGVRGILYYGDLNNCAGELTGTQARSYSDIGPIEALAGIPATLGEHPTLGFAAVNPEFVRWARRTLLPSPDQWVDGISVQLAYDRVFHRFFRVMALSLLTIHDRWDLDVEAQSYSVNVQQGFDGIDWVTSRYAGAIADPYSTRDGTTMTPGMAAGFWLRRWLDGSYPDCWHALREVLVRYDRAWLDAALAAHPTAARILAAVPDPLAGQGDG